MTASPATLPAAEIASAISGYAELRDTILNRFPPTGQRPEFDIPRFWSNPSLADPDRIISLVLAKPSMADLARTIHAYGPDRVMACLGQMIEQGSLEGSRAPYTIRLVKLAMEGVADAAHELATG